MPQWGICGGEAPKQPGITEDGTCDRCDRKVVLAEATQPKQPESK